MTARLRELAEWMRGINGHCADALCASGASIAGRWRSDAAAYPTEPTQGLAYAREHGERRAAVEVGQPVFRRGVRPRTCCEQLPPKA